MAARKMTMGTMVTRSERSPSKLGNSFERQMQNQKVPNLCYYYWVPNLCYLLGFV